MTQIEERIDGFILDMCRALGADPNAHVTCRQSDTMTPREWQEMWGEDDFFLTATLSMSLRREAALLLAAQMALQVGEDWG